LLEKAPREHGILLTSEGVGAGALIPYLGAGNKVRGQLDDPPDILQNKSSRIRRIDSVWNPDLVFCRLGEETTNTSLLP